MFSPVHRSLQCFFYTQIDSVKILPGSVPIFCKIPNFKRFLSQEFEINRLVSRTVSKNLTLNLQQIRDTAKITESGLMTL